MRLNIKESIREFIDEVKYILTRPVFDPWILLLILSAWLMYMVLPLLLSGLIT
jgi:hypothetical protein